MIRLCILVLIVVSFSLVLSSYADTNWQDISVNSPLDNNTKYQFYYSGNIEYVDVSYSPPLLYPFLMFNTTQATNDIWFKIPKSFPTDSSFFWLIITDSLGPYLEPERHKENNCFCVYTTNVANSTKVGLGIITVLPTQPHDIKEHPSPDYCLPHTIADYSDTLETYENIRGEQVRVYLSSVLELLKRNYLAPIQNDIETPECR